MEGSPKTIGETVFGDDDGPSNANLHIAKLIHRWNAPLLVDG